MSCSKADDDAVVDNDVAAGHETPASASSRALRLPELVAAILAQLRPGDPALGAFDDDDDKDECADDVDWRYDDGAESYECADVVKATAEAFAAGAAAGLASLRSAALVNHTWFAAAVPLLWRRPLQNAFGADAGAMEPARRVFYAAHVQVVYLTRQAELWFALTGGESCDSGSGNNEAIIGNESQDRNGASVDFSDGRGLRLPRLKVLHFGLYLDGDWLSTRSSQPSLQRLVGAHLTELSCHLSAHLMRCLGAYNPAEAAPMRLRLRKLMLYGRDPDDSDADGGEVEALLLAWLAKQPALPLASLRLVSVFSFAAEPLTDLAFGQFALRADLRQLWLNDDGPYHVRPVSRRAVEDIVTAAGAQRVGAQPPQIFAQLADLSVSLRLAAIRSLAPLLPAVTRLTIHVRRVDDDGGSDNLGRVDVATSVFGPLAALTQLRRLRVLLCDGLTISRAAVLSLRSLTQLRELRMDVGNITGAVHGFDDTELAAVLGAMPHLHTLALELPLMLSDDSLRVIGVACRRLRRLHIDWNCSLAPALEHELPEPLFPRLEYFWANGLIIQSCEVGSQLARLRSVGESHARLLHANAPRLKEISFFGLQSSFSGHVKHAFFQLAMRDGRCWSAEEVEVVEALAQECTLCKA